MKDSYLTAGIRLGPLLKLLSRNRISFRPGTMLRVAFLLQSAAWSSLFATVERIRYSRELKNTEAPDDPVFIIGHWRTGSTFLHQLMALDPGFQAPTLFQVALPDSFLVSHPYYKPLFRCVVSKNRPMDNVKIGMDEPQEDEYAIYRLTSMSPLEYLVFPKGNHYFLDTTLPILPADETLAIWKSDFLRFFRKLKFHDQRRIVSKNPFNSFRIPILLKMFPRAKFIHIVRHPDNVIPSTIHMWKILQEQNSMYPALPPEFQDVTRVLADMMHMIRESVDQMTEGTFTEIRYEDLEMNPVATLEKIYSDLSLPFTHEFNEKIETFIRSNSGFRKNEFLLSEKEKQLIREKLGIFMKRYNYD